MRVIKQTVLILISIFMFASCADEFIGENNIIGQQNKDFILPSNPGYALKDILHLKTKENHKKISYSGLWNAFKETDDKYNKHNIVWDIYSDIPNVINPRIPDGNSILNGKKEYEYMLGNNQCGNYRGENSCYNREHSFPKSWFGKKKSHYMYSDLHHMYPTDGYVNGRRSNYPYGEVKTVSWISTNGSKLGKDHLGQVVFEPIDEYKGDLARTYFYIATRYQDEIALWEKITSNSDLVLDGSSDKVFEEWFLNLLLKWHKNDPVSQKEKDRNDAIEILQGNRNPYIDNPEYINRIWGN